MSRELLILRHAHAEPLAASGTDIDRPLSARGEAEADAVGRWLAHQDARLARVLSSPAVRARATAERALAPLQAPAIQFDPRIYEATPGDLLGLLDPAAGEGATLIVGHNPGFEQLVALLTEGRSGDFRGLPTGGLAWLSLPAQGPLEPGVAALKAFWWP